MSGYDTIRSTDEHSKYILIIGRRVCFDVASVREKELLNESPESPVISVAEEMDFFNYRADWMPAYRTLLYRSDTVRRGFRICKILTDSSLSVWHFIGAFLYTKITVACGRII